MSGTIGAIPVGTAEPYTRQEAEAVLVGYCFATVQAGWSAPSGPAYGEPPQLDPRAVWACRTYDTVDPDRGSELRLRDLLIPAGLNAEFNQQRYASLQVVAEAVSEALSHIPESVTLWALEAQQIPTRDEPAAHGTVPWWMYRAWWLLMGSKDLSTDITHMLLHHKRPLVFPLIDDRTDPYLQPDPWRAIHSDLHTPRSPSSKTASAPWNDSSSRPSSVFASTTSCCGPEQRDKTCPQRRQGARSHSRPRATSRFAGGTRCRTGAL